MPTWRRVSVGRLHLGGRDIIKEKESEKKRIKRIKKESAVDSRDDGQCLLTGHRSRIDRSRKFRCRWCTSPGSSWPASALYL